MAEGVLPGVVDAYVTATLEGRPRWGAERKTWAPDVAAYDED